MKRIGLVLAAVASAPLFAGGVNEQPLRTAEARLCAAFEGGDAAALRQYMDATFTLTNSHGEVTGFAQNLAEVAAREPRYEVFRNHDQTIRFYGDTAIVLGITSVKGTASGTPFAGEFQYTDTWIRRGGRWLIVASHASRRAD